jgi:glycosyltransferase involved in cell wall biosynthesis
LREVQEIAEAVRFTAARVAKLRLVVLGRETRDLETPFQEALKGTNVAISVLGVLPGDEVVRTLRAAAVQLFVRSPIASRRGSAIAGIACGLPVVARAGCETAAPVTEAGVAFYSPNEQDEPGVTLARVLSDDSYRAALAEKSRRAYEQHFSWDAIAKKYVAALGARG